MKPWILLWWLISIYPIPFLSRHVNGLTGAEPEILFDCSILSGKPQNQSESVIYTK